MQAVLPKPDYEKYIVDLTKLDPVRQTSFTSGITSLATAQVVKLERAYTRAIVTLTKCGLVASLAPPAHGVGSATLSACCYGGRTISPAHDISLSCESSSRESEAFYSLYGSDNNSSCSSADDGAVFE